MPIPALVRWPSEIIWDRFLKKHSDDLYAVSKKELPKVMAETMGISPGSFSESYSLCLRYCTEFCPASIGTIDRVLAAMNFSRSMMATAFLSALVLAGWAQNYIAALVFLAASATFGIRFLRFEKQQFQVIFQTTLVSLLMRRSSLARQEKENPGAKE